MSLYSHYISGGCLSGGGFTSGAVIEGSLDGYERTIKLLREVLDAAAPGGNSYWGNQGICVSRWNHEGRALVPLEGPSKTFNARPEFEEFLRQNGVKI